MAVWTEEHLNDVSCRGAEFFAAEIERCCSVSYSVRAVLMRSRAGSAACSRCTRCAGDTARWGRGSGAVRIH